MNAQSEVRCCGLWGLLESEIERKQVSLIKAVHNDPLNSDRPSVEYANSDEREAGGRFMKWMLVGGLTVGIY